MRPRRDPALDQAASAPAGPERRCVLTGAHGGRDALLRLALAPDGRIVPDLAAKLPGRGAWVVPDAAVLGKALGNGKLKAALARAFKEPPATLLLSDDLPGQIGQLLAKRGLDRLGLELKAGHIVTGADKASDVVRSGRSDLVLHAADAADDGKRKLALPGVLAITLPVGRDELSLALGRELVVHAAVVDPRAAARVVAELRRWFAFLGLPFPVADDLMTGRKAD